MDLRVIGWADVNQIHLVQGRVQGQALVNTVMNLCVQ